MKFLTSKSLLSICVLGFLFSSSCSADDDDLGYGVSDGLEHVSIRGNGGYDAIDGNKNTIDIGPVTLFSDFAEPFRTNQYFCVRLQKTDQLNEWDKPRFQVTAFRSSEKCSVFLSSGGDPGYGVSNNLEYVTLRGDGGRAFALDGNKKRIFISTLFRGKELFITRQQFCAKLVEFKSPFSGGESKFQVNQVHGDKKCSVFLENTHHDTVTEK